MNTNSNRIQENEFTLNTILTKKGAESIQILNEIDFLITNASTIPLTSKVMVDAEYLFSLAEKFRKSLPADLEQSEIVINEVQDIVADAEAKAESIIVNSEAQAKFIISDAEAKAHMILNESRILQEAQERASCIINEALYTKNQMQKEAEGYVYSLFEEAEAKLLAGVGAVQEAVKSMRNS